MIQKYHRGDLVHLADEFPTSMKHFSGRGKLAAVCGSYSDLHLDGDSARLVFDREHDYELDIEGTGRVAWYPESLLTLISSSRVEMPVVNGRVVREDLL